MKRVLIAALLSWTACTSRPQELVGNRAFLAGVSSDQGWLALLENDTTYPNGTHTGKLVVQPVAGGAPLTLDGNSAGGTFSRGRALWFLGGVTIVQEGTPPLPRYWGTLSVWLPGMSAPIPVGSNVRDFLPSRDGSAVVFMDFTAPSAAAPGKLVTVSSATCGTGSCMPLMLAEDITAAQAAWRISDDGKVVLATIKGANSGDPGSVVLAQPALGALQILSTTAGTRSPQMTPAGDAIAWVEGLDKIITSPALPARLTALPTNAQYVEGLAMIGARDFVAKVRPIGSSGVFGPVSLARVNAAGTTSLGVEKPGELFVSQDVPAVTTSHVFYTTAPDTTTGNSDLWLLDLDTLSAPLRLATEAVSPIGDGLQFSDDGKAVCWLDNFDPTTRLGDLTATTLATPGANLVAGGVRGGAFEPGSTHLLFINAPDRASGAGVLTLLSDVSKPPLVEGVGLVNFSDSRASPLRTYYTQRTGGRDDGVWSIAQP